MVSITDVLDGATLTQARRRQELTNPPELTGEHGRARLVVLACEVGGRWSDETCFFIAVLARAKARSEPRAIWAAARRAWHRRWSTLMACCGDPRIWFVPPRTFASSFVFPEKFLFCTDMPGSIGWPVPAPRLHIDDCFEIHNLH